MNEKQTKDHRPTATPTIGSLFAGIGGLDLGFERAGWRSAWQVEIDPIARAVLGHRFPDARQFEDVRHCSSLLKLSPDGLQHHLAEQALVRQINSAEIDNLPGQIPAEVLLADPPAGLLLGILPAQGPSTCAPPRVNSTPPHCPPAHPR